MSERSHGRGGLTRLIRTLVRMLGLAVLAVLFYLFIIMVQPDRTSTDPVDSQGVLQASAPQSIVQLSELRELAKAFPVPVLMASSSAGMNLQGAVSFDKPFEKGYGRILRLVYQTDSGMEVQVDSIYPARAISLMEGGSYRISGTAGHTVAGCNTVRMETASHIRLHMQTDQGLYSITIPSEGAEGLTAVVRTLHLYTVE